MGVIRDLQGQATAKSGASKQSSSFLKATTMTLFTISESEKASYADQIDSYLGNDPFLKQFLPIDPATKDLFNLVKDGVLLWLKGFILFVHFAASSVAWLDFSDYKESLDIDVNLSYDCMQNDPTDGKAYAYLLNILAPDHCNPSMLDTKDPKERARVILDHAERESAILKSFVALAIPRDVELYECSCLLINGCKISLYRFSFPALSQKYVKGKVIVGDLPPVTGKLKAFIFNKEEIAGILNELYGDLSNEIESEDFLKEATYLFYCMELGVIRDLQGQATAKSGASKQSSSFLKATTMTLFTISESEKASYADQIDSYLGDDPFLKQFLPIDPATKDLFYLLFSEQQHGRLVDRRRRRQSHHLKQGGFDLWSERDGPQLFETPDGVPSARFSPKGAVQTAGLLESSHKRFTQSCERWSAVMLVNIVVPGIIDERAVNIRTHGIGCTVVNIRTRDLVGGRPASNMEKFGNLNWTKLFLLTFQRLNRSWKR
ncbi:hypothetical protein DKX38_022415 [Salix brachista]|uniref:Uncharacterized protein n=1 Tax=Salix brachista TaxID=2182728 RepID=A0A5N5K1B4_9ROSI|nr:hypothetical protein DKX38_022415 [Salix brachista]